MPSARTLQKWLICFGFYRLCSLCWFTTRQLCHLELFFLLGWDSGSTVWWGIPSLTRQYMFFHDFRVAVVQETVWRLGKRKEKKYGLCWFPMYFGICSGLVWCLLSKESVLTILERWIVSHRFPSGRWMIGLMLLPVTVMNSNSLSCFPSGFYEILSFWISWFGRYSGCFAECHVSAWWLRCWYWCLTRQSILLVRMLWLCSWLVESYLVSTFNWKTSDIFHIVFCFHYGSWLGFRHDVRWRRSYMCNWGADWSRGICMRRLDYSFPWNLECQLSSSAFIIYATHEFTLTAMQWLWSRFIPDSALLSLVQWLSLPCIAIPLCAVWTDIAQIVAKRIRIGDRWTMNFLVCNWNGLLNSASSPKQTNQRSWRENHEFLFSDGVPLYAFS